MTTFATWFSGLCAFAGVPENMNGQVRLVQVLFTHGGSANMTPHDPFLAVPEKNLVSGCLPDFVLGASPDAYAVWRLHGFRLRYPAGPEVDWMVNGLFNISTCHATPGSQNNRAQRDALSAGGAVAGLVELCSGRMQEAERIKQTVRYKDLGGNEPSLPPDPHPPLSVVHTLKRDRLLLLELIPLDSAVGSGRLIAIVPEIVRDKDGNPVIDKDGNVKTADAVRVQISNYQHPEPPPTEPILALHHFIAHYDFLASSPAIPDRYFPIAEETHAKETHAEKMVMGLVLARPTGANCFTGPLMAALSGTVDTEHVHGHHVARPVPAAGGALPSI